MRLFIYIIPFLFISCSTKKVEELAVKILKTKVKPTDRLKTLTNNIKQYCQTRVKQHDEYLQIRIHTDKNFHKGSYILSLKTKDHLKCIIPFIKEEDNITIQLNAYSSNKDKKKAQNISDNRAISVAELLYNEGVREEIFAKGCIENNNIDILIFIYTKKEYFQNQCK